jgi:competence protein ComGC
MINRDKKSFTLVEVLISITIISIVGLALLKLNANSTKMINYLSEKSGTNEHISLFAVNLNEDLHNKKKSLYEIIEKKYNIRNDDVRKALKNKEYNIKYKEISVTNLLEEDVEDNELVDENANDEESQASLILTISKISISNEKQGAYINYMTLEGKGL